ncbi:DUF2326 domain-containing protein [Paenibacillus sp. CFBP13512]|uniref:DUF2326 domain-containing protein n=1 Tax=Paenibacillus sp. CFBP13512 TaxID=2184007 RepID=UPI0010C06D8F|nr:DUF2326 domain-containing protein [Paenibacillus sp. CFBP13512]TKJ86071.1 DUF2326 domain-containing protein [Paenibacillus sp. CFBP13512]
MIIRRLIIYSYQLGEILKEYRFNEFGLNLILGEKKGQGKGQETNGVGKTTMVESLDYLLGGSCPNDFVGKPELSKRDILLILEISSGDQDIYLARLINQPDAGYILPNKTVSFDLTQWIDKDDDGYKKYINHVVMGLNEKTPSFSALKEYIIRDEKAGFLNVGLPNRKAMNEASNLAYLFNLPHDFEKEISNYKKQHRELNQKLSIIKSFKDEISDLKIREKKLNKEIQELDNIIQKVNISKKLSKDAENYQLSKSEYNQLQNSLFELQHIKKQYQSNIQDLKTKLDEIKLLNDIQPFYEQLIGFFPEKVEKNQADIEKFYNFMVENRGRYFSHKISEIDYEIDKKQKRINELNKTIQRQTKSFRNTDIIADITKINEDKSIKFEELAQIRVKISMDQEKTNITAEINRIKQEILRQIEIKLDIFKSYEEKILNLKEIFNELVIEAYGETGIFDIELVNDTSLNATTGRVKINCTIDDEKSHGRLHMKINIFDLTWFLNGLNYRDNLTFLMHDGSYSKPNGDAKFKLLKYIDLELKARAMGQYFATVNVNELENSELSELDDANCVVARLVRTDDNKERFFGFRYTT